MGWGFSLPSFKWDPLKDVSKSFGGGGSGGVSVPGFTMNLGNLDLSTLFNGNIAKDVVKTVEQIDPIGKATNDLMSSTKLDPLKDYGNISDTVSKGDDVLKDVAKVIEPLDPIGKATGDFLGEVLKPTIDDVNKLVKFDPTKDASDPFGTLAKGGEAIGGMFTKAWKNLESSSTDAWKNLESSSTDTWKGVEDAAAKIWKDIEGLWGGGSKDESETTTTETSSTSTAPGSINTSIGSLLGTKSETYDEDEKKSKNIKKKKLGTRALRIPLLGTSGFSNPAASGVSK